MKKSLVVLSIALCAATIANAQVEYKPFRVGLGLGYAIPSGGGGVCFSVEPQYLINPHINVGLRISGALMAVLPEGMDDVSGSKVSFNGSYLATGDYYFTTGKFRLFAGLGLGLYSLTGASFEDDVDALSGSKFGFMVRAGFDVSHFRLGLEYNIPGTLKETYEIPGVGSAEAKMKFNYFAVTANVTIGGGKR